MNAPDPVVNAAGENDPTRGLAQRTATAITVLWGQDGPPMTGPVRMREPERVLAVCGQVHRQWPRRPRGRSATAAVQRLLGTVIGYARILHPPLDWALVGGGGDPTHPGCAPALVWKNDVSGQLVVDLLRAPVQCAPLLDAAAQQALTGWGATPGVTAFRVVDVQAPRRTRVLVDGRTPAGFDLRPERLWTLLDPAALAADRAPARMVVA